MKRVLGVTHDKTILISSEIGNCELIRLFTYVLPFTFTHSGVTYFNHKLYEQAIPHFKELMGELVSQFGYNNVNTLRTVQNLAVNLGCIVEKNWSQLSNGKMHDPVLLERIINDLNEAIEYFNTVVTCSERCSPKYSLIYILTLKLAHSFTQS